MSPKFFFYKMREVASFLKMMRGKATGIKKDHVEGVERRHVLSDRPQKAQEKVLRQSGGQDISAI